MKRNKHSPDRYHGLRDDVDRGWVRFPVGELQAFPLLLFLIAVACLFAFAGCAVTRGLTVGEEFCSVGCAQFGGKMLWSEGHRCVCEFELPHVTGKAAETKDNLKGVQL